MLIDAAELRARLAAGERFTLLDARDSDAWRTATLPDAHAFNVYDYFIPDSTEQEIAAMAGVFQRAWQSLGTDSATPVWFEEETGMRSPRGAWFHWLIGRDDALILNGGVRAWQNAGGELRPGRGEHTLLAPQPGADNAVRFQRERVASREEVLRADGERTVILDARRASEHDGSFVHDCCARAGRIPGSQLLFWEEVIADGKFRPAAEIRAAAHKAGFSPHQRIITYCHRGARAATVYAALKHAGFRDLAVYVGSWHEWSEHKELPVAP